jgi:hypothetical protein
MSNAACATTSPVTRMCASVRKRDDGLVPGPAAATAALTTPRTTSASAGGVTPRRTVTPRSSLQARRSVQRAGALNDVRGFVRRLAPVDHGAQPADGPASRSLVSGRFCIAGCRAEYDLGICCRAVIQIASFRRARAFRCARARDRPSRGSGPRSEGHLRHARPLRRQPLQEKPDAVRAVDCTALQRNLRRSSPISLIRTSSTMDCSSRMPRSAPSACCTRTRSGKMPSIYRDSGARSGPPSRACGPTWCIACTTVTMP